MAARILDFVTTTWGLIAGLAAVTVGALAFVMVALLAMFLSGVSGNWLALPCVVMVMGVGTVGAWLVFGQGAQHVEPTPVADQHWLG